MGARLQLLALSLWPLPVGAGVRWRQRGLNAESEILRQACFERAAQAGDRDALVLLGELHARRGHRDLAWSLFRAAAEGGHAVGAFRYAELTRWEFPGGAQGLQASETWYQRAAEAGYGPAIAWLAHAFEAGEGRPVDEVRAQSWAARPVTVSWPPEGRPAGSSLQARAARAWEALDEAGGQWATRPWFPPVLMVVVALAVQGTFWWLGVPSCGLILLLLALIGLASRRWISALGRQARLARQVKAAEAGYPEAHLVLGRAYREGSADIPRDRRLAGHHFRQAAEAGLPEAMVALADLLQWGLTGEGPQVEEAAQWRERARALGHTESPTSLQAPAAPREAVTLTGLWERWDLDWGPRLAPWLLGAATLVLLVLVTRVLYRNTGWLGRREQNRIVWGDALNRVAAPRDPGATRPIPAEARPTVKPFSFQVIHRDGTGVAGNTAAFLGKPVLLVLAKGQYPAFRETLEELDGLAASHRDRAAVLFVTLDEGRTGVGSLIWLGELKVLHLTLAVAGPEVHQPAFGDLTFTPMTFVLDPQGRVRQRWQGYQPRLMGEALEAALEESAQPPR